MAEGRITDGWGESLRELLEYAGLPESHVAAHLKVNRAMLHQWLRYLRKPSWDQVSRINETVGTLLHREREVAAYLNAVALYDPRLSSNEREVATAVEDLADAIAFATPFLREDADEEILDCIMQKCSPEQRRNLVLDCARRSRRRLIRGLERRPERKLWIDELCHIFLRHGIDLTPWLEKTEIATVRRRDDQLEADIQHAIGSSELAPIDRAVLENKILEHVWRFVAVDRHEWPKLGLTADPSMHYRAGYHASQMAPGPKGRRAK